MQEEDQPTVHNHAASFDCIKIVGPRAGLVLVLGLTVPILAGHYTSNACGSHHFIPLICFQLLFKLHHMLSCPVTAPILRNRFAYDVMSTFLSLRYRCMEPCILGPRCPSNFEPYCMQVNYPWGDWNKF